MIRPYDILIFMEVSYCMENEIKNEQFFLQSLKCEYASLLYSDFFKTKIFGFAIEQLLDCSDLSKKKTYLQVALLHMRAYVQFGYDISIYEELFIKILDQLKLNKDTLFENYVYSNKRTKVAKTAIKGILGTWKVSEENPKSVSDTVEEIYDKLKRRETGIFEYRYVRNRITYIYELVITPEYSFLHNVNYKKYYVFEN